MSMKADPIRKHLKEIQEAVSSVEAACIELSEYVLENADEAEPSKRRGRPPGGGKKTPRKKASTKKKDEEEVTAEDCRTAVLRVIEATDNKTAIEAIGSVQDGAKMISHLEEENYAAALEALESVLDEVEEDPAG